MLFRENRGDAPAKDRDSPLKQRPRSSLLASLLYLVGAAWFLAAGDVSAFPCDRGFVRGPDLVPLSYACQDGPSGDSNDWDNVGTVFGTDDWIPLSKIGLIPQDTDVRVDIGLTFSRSPDLLSGSWGFSSFDWDDWERILIVIKDGNFNQIFWSAYEVLDPDTNGSWRMCNENQTGNDCKQISHLSVYGIPDGGGQAPEPGSLLLFGAALLALLGLRRGRGT